MATRTPDNPSRRRRSPPLQQELSCTGSPRFSNSVSAHASTSVICDSNSTFTSNSPLGSSPPSFRLSSSPRSSIFGSSPQPSISGSSSQSSISGSSSQSSISGSSSQSLAFHSWPPSPSPKSSPQSDTDNYHVEEPICNARPGKRKFDTTPTKTPSRHPAPPHFVSPDFCPGSDTDGSSFEKEDNCRSQPSLQAAPGRLRAAKSVPNLIISEEHSPLDIERPETLPRGRKDPGQQQKTRKRSDRSIDRELARLIRDEGSKAIEASKDKMGSNYVFKATRQPDNRPIFKVGTTANAPENRSGAYRRRCKLKNDEFLAGSELPKIRMYKMAEKLILMELTNFVIREDKCPGCGERHKEYLRDVDEKHLLKVHRRWHAFCRVEPWGEDGRLKKRWGHWLERKQKTPLPAPARAGYNDPGAVARAWQAFVRPTMLERLELEVKIHALSARHLWCETRPYLSDGFSAVLAAVILWPSLWALAPPCLWLVAIVWWAVDPEEIRSFAALPGYLDPPGRQAVFFESGEEALPAEDGEVGAEELYREISGREKTPGAWPV